MKEIEESGEQLEKEIGKILRKRKRSGRSKYKQKEKTEISYPERKPMVRARRRKKEEGKHQEGGPKEGESQLRGGKDSDDQELVGRMGTPEKMNKGNSSDKPPLSTGLTAQPKNLEVFDLKQRNGENRVKEKINKIEEKKKEIWRGKN